MKKLAVGFTCALAICLFAGARASARASLPAATTGPGDLCVLFEIDAPPGSILADEVTTATTPGGIAMQTCKGTVPNDTGHTVVLNGRGGDLCYSVFSLGTELSTDVWQERITASGEATLTCMFTKK